MKPDEEDTTEKTIASKKSKKGKIQHDEVSSTTKVTLDINSHIKNYKPRQYLLVKSGQSWLDVQVCKPTHSLQQQQSI